MTKTKLPRLIFDYIEDVYEYFTFENKDILLEILDSIEHGIKQKLNDVDIFEIQRSNSKVILVFNLPINDWGKNLKWLMEKFIKLEEYELADRIKKLLEVLKQSK